MRILGIDCAVARTGYGVLEEESGRSPSLVACGVIVTSAKDAFPQRLRRIYNRIQKVVEEFAPDQVALEDIFYHRIPKNIIGYLMSQMILENIHIHNIAVKKNSETWALVVR